MFSGKMFQIMTRLDSLCFACAEVDMCCQCLKYALIVLKDLTPPLEQVITCNADLPWLRARVFQILYQCL